MAILSWNEIKTRATEFVNEWKDSETVREKAEAQTFETDFLHIFGVNRKKVALFEHEVHFGDERDGLSADTATSGARGYIDLFWRGNIIIEMKTPGKDLNKAFEQAKNYALTLPQKEIPKAILTSDFLNFQFYDLEDNAKRYQFTLEELPAHVALFGYLAGYKDVTYKTFDPVNVEAAEKMGKLHDRLKEIGYSGHPLEVYLVRLLFCLFADDTAIFPHDHFINYILTRTNQDGSDLALHLHKIFEVLDTPEESRLQTLDEQLNAFPYIDGGLFSERLNTADFNSVMRNKLIECCTLDWSKISPAIFGAMFQSVMDSGERHDAGAHYTSEENILKVIHPLFLDALWAEFEKLKRLTSDIRVSRISEFHEKLARLKFLDPACGCGNFLVISYRELRLLEIEVIGELLGNEKLLDIEHYIKVNVDQFYGIEIKEFPAKVAETAMWLMDHQMNVLAGDRFGLRYNRIPLCASASIHCKNAFDVDWESIVPKDELSYILGNPPFLGASVMSASQKADVEKVFDRLKGCNSLDYVTCWYARAAEYIQNTQIEVAFVSTNSICQGEQVPILWPKLLYTHQIKINFAHQTFKWSNEARGKAAVHCVIIGFALTERTKKSLFLYEDVQAKPQETAAKQINPYLVDAMPVIIQKRTAPLCAVPKMAYGSKPTDGGHLIFTEAEKNEFLQKEPAAAVFMRQFIGSQEYINNEKRYCLWLSDAEPNILRKMPLVLERIEQVKQMRLQSTSPTTRESASRPARFFTVAQPDSDYLIVPEVSSENRAYIPIGFMTQDIVVSNKCLVIPNATLYHFGVLTSTMHMAWTRYVSGRLKSDFQYSASIVYNNFSWPTPTDKQAVAIEQAAQAVLDARAKFPNSALADLYDPLTMPPELTKAHRKLDKAVEKAYGREFAGDPERVAHLFELYQKLSGELFRDEKKHGKGRKAK